MKVKLNFPNVQILMRTLDPFTGVLYVERAERLVRGARTVDRGCLVRGSGRHDVQLSVRAGQCGWSRDGSVVRLDVYLQYDTYVQQVNTREILIYRSRHPHDFLLAVQRDLASERRHACSNRTTSTLYLM